MTKTEMVWKALRYVIDPELGQNLVDLGLIYEVEVNDDAVRVRMTATSPMCPMGQYLVESAEESIRRFVPDAASVEVRLVWEPAWTPERMHPDLQQIFGWS